MQHHAKGAARCRRGSRALAHLTGLLGAVLVAAVAISTSRAASARDPMAEVSAFERHLEQVYSSQQFIDDPSIALPYYEKSSTLRMFDAISPLQFKGAEVGKHIADIGNQFFGTVKFYDIDIVAGPKLAFASMLQHFTGKLKDGTPVDFIMRVTDCLRWSDGHWLIAQEHISVPVEPAAFAAMIKVNK
jgi:ketosteroid isomerase-like protein